MIDLGFYREFLLYFRVWVWVYDRVVVAVLVCVCACARASVESAHSGLTNAMHAVHMHFVAFLFYCVVHLCSFISIPVKVVGSFNH